MMRFHYNRTSSLRNPRNNEITLHIISIGVAGICGRHTKPLANLGATFPRQEAKSLALSFELPCHPKINGSHQHQTCCSVSSLGAKGLKVARYCDTIIAQRSRSGVANALLMDNGMDLHQMHQSYKLFEKCYCLSVAVKRP
eukprot:scaffold41071_cov28-Tisochrysis_lutea.AAC.1